MNKTIKLTICIFLTVAVALVASGCNFQRNGSPSDSGNEETELMKPFAPYPETVTVSVARHLNLGNPLAEGVTTSDNIYIDVIRDVLNVKVVIDWEATPGDYKQKLALAIASDTLPDTFHVEDYLTLRWLAENGKLADLTEAFESCIGGYDAILIDMMEEGQNNNYYYDDMLLGISQVSVGYNYNLLWVRRDWLDALGLPPPQTLGEIKETALAFMENNMGGRNTQGIIVNPDTIFGNSDSFLSFSTIANSLGAYPTSWVIDPRGSGESAVYGSMLPGTKRALEVLNDWYEAGVLDPKFMSYPDMDAVTPAITEGRVGMFFGAYWSPWIVGYSIDKPEVQWVPVLAPLSESGVFNRTNSILNTAYLVVSSTCDNPEAVIKACNVASELQRGAYNSDPVIKAEIDRLTAAGCFGRTLNPFPLGLAGMFGEEAKRGVAYMEYCRTGVLNAIPGLPIEMIQEDADKCFAWHRGDRVVRTIEDVENRILYESYKTAEMIYLAENQHDEPVVFIGITESMEFYWTTLFELEQRMVIQIVSGDRPLEYFDEIVERWRLLGGDLITVEVNEILN